MSKVAQQKYEKQQQHLLVIALEITTACASHQIIFRKISSPPSLAQRQININDLLVINFPHLKKQTSKLLLILILHVSNNYCVVFLLLYQWVTTGREISNCELCDFSIESFKPYGAIVVWKMDFMKLKIISPMESFAVKAEQKMQFRSSYEIIQNFILALNDRSRFSSRGKICFIAIFIAFVVFPSESFPQSFDIASATWMACFFPGRWNAF